MKHRKRLGNEIISIVLTLVMIVSTFTGIVPGTIITAKATSYTTIQMNGNTLQKGGENWSLNSSNKLELNAGMYRLGSDIKTYRTIIVTGNVTLDLNGYGICKFNGDEHSRVIKVGDSTDGHLTLTDSNPNSKHYITVVNSEVTGVSDEGTPSTLTHSTYGYNGVVEVTGGYITGGRSNSGVENGGGGVNVNKGSFTMQGGNITCNTCLGNSESGSICVESNAEFTMSGGSINNNFTVVSNPCGSGVRVIGTFVMSGGSITDNIMWKSETNDNGMGGGVFSAGTFTMTGGKIIGNTATYKGGGVCISMGTFSMSGGEITGNKVDGKGCEGGGVYVDKNSVNPTFNVSGNPVIDDNHYIPYKDGNAQTPVERNVEINTPRTINVIKGLSEGAKIGVYCFDQTYNTDYPCKFTSGYSTNNAVSETVTPPSNYFFSDSGYGVVLTDGEAATVEYVPIDTTKKPTINVTRDENPIAEGAPQVGDVLTVTPNPTNAGPASKIHYVWYRGDDHFRNGDGEEYASYTLTTADVGKTIKVKVMQITSSVSVGVPEADREQISEPTLDVVKKTAPVLSEANARTYAGINYIAETATPTSGYEVSADGENVATSPVSLTDILNGTSPKIYVRSKETDDTAAGDWVAVTLTERPDAPYLTVTNASDKTEEDGSINVTTTIMEYSSDGGENWTDASETSTTVKAGTYLVRYKATTSAPAGKTAEVTVGVKPLELKEAQKPTAKTGLVYNGSAQELVSVPANLLPEGCTMKYAVTTTDTAPADTDYTFTNESLPTGTNAGDYYVWYKAFADENHADSVAERLSVSIAKKTDLTGVSAVQAANETLVYDGTSKTPTITVKDGDTTLTEGTDYTVKYVGVAPTVYEESATTPTSAGDYKAVITFMGNYDGSKDVAFTISKADQTKPDDLTVTKTSGEGKNDGKISGLNSTDKYEYSINGGTDWTPVEAGETEIDNLAAGEIVIRKQGDENTNPSETVSVTIGTKADQTAPNIDDLTVTKTSGADKTDGKISGLNSTDKYEYLTNDGTTWTPVGEDKTSIDNLPAGEIQIRKQGDDDHNPSEAAEITIGVKEDQTAPNIDDLTVTKTSGADKTDGKISGLNSTDKYEYLTNDGTTWTPVGEDKTSIDNLPAGEIQIRKQGDADYNPSEAVEVTIGVKEEQTPPKKDTISVTNASDENVSDGKITGVDDTMEYSAKKDTTWTPDDTTWTPVDTGKTVIENLPEGDYEIRKKGDADHNPSDSVMVTIGVTSRTQGVVKFNKEGSANTETGVKSAESSNIDAYAGKHYAEGKDVKLKLEVTPVKEENVAAASVTGTKQATEKLFAAIDKTMVASDYIEIDLAKYVDSAKTGNISDTGTPLEIELDYDTDKVKSVPVVVRTHNGTTKVFERLSARPASNYKDATYYAENGKVYLYSQYFSDFALVYAKLKSYYVTIDTGVGEPIVSFISEGSGIALPENPAKDGYNFKGWYTDPEGKTAWDKDKDKVSEDLNIYAGWDKAVTGVTATADKDTLTKAGDTAQISVVVSPSDAANKKVSFTSSDQKVVTVDANGKITAVANGTAVITVTTEDGAKTATITVTVKIDKAVTDNVTTEATGGKKDNDVTTETPVEIKDNVIRDDKNSVAMNSGFKLDQTASKLKVAWGRVKEADGYELYVTYCGTKFGEAAKEIKNNKITSATVTKINGKKLNLKKNYKLYIAAYKLVDGKKVRLANTIVGHVVGRKNTKYTNVKKVTVKKSKFTIKVGKTAKIKAKTVLVQKGKKQLSNAHAAQFRYLSINKDVATVDKNGKIKGVAKGTATVYVYARNGYAKKVKVIVK